MSKKLSKKDIEKKLKYHEGRVEFYWRKLQDAEVEEKRIGFKLKN